MNKWRITSQTSVPVSGLMGVMDFSDTSVGEHAAVGGAA